MNAIQNRIVVEHAGVFAAQLRGCVESVVAEMRIDANELVEWRTIKGVRYLVLCGSSGVAGRCNIQAESIAEGLDRLESMLENTGYCMTINEGGEPCITRIS